MSSGISRQEQITNFVRAFESNITGPLGRGNMDEATSMAQKIYKSAANTFRPFGLEDMDVVRDELHRMAQLKECSFVVEKTVYRFVRN